MYRYRTVGPRKRKQHLVFLLFWPCAKLKSNIKKLNFYSYNNLAQNGKCPIFIMVTPRQCIVQTAPCPQHLWSGIPGQSLYYILLLMMPKCYLTKTTLNHLLNSLNQQLLRCYEVIFRKGCKNFKNLSLVCPF